MQRFEDEAEAVQLANATQDCLSQSGRATSIVRCAREVEAGSIWIDDWPVLHDQFEEGGCKQSGQGRMRGLAVLNDFPEYKHMTLSSGLFAAAQT